MQTQAMRDSGRWTRGSVAQLEVQFKPLIENVQGEIDRVF
jgi:hypothetical protein